ncbi:MarR family winged helix-turn-helix transcriptional regulator [Nigerium massiliense]|uniref:MarR family winged helix-turn-helix transcriptional regulator n=1 Tax=Nigerium massiliense TaxID=1522317 RepID=UPI0005915381|nr:MarR family transcriptional regulator [Nigerium massiliense]
MSHQPRRDPEASTLRRDVVVAVREMQGGAHDVDSSAAEHLGINHTDLAILRFLDGGPRSPKELAASARITPASMTVALRRLEAAGWVSREHDPGDGRRAIVRLTPRAVTSLAELYGPIAREGKEILEELSDAELRTVLGFLEPSAAMQRRQADRIRGLAAPTD